ncbi:MAG: acetyl-CoA carboxylase carboxyl transferase subunit beta, partial [Chlamydiia bacterium]|nr:acetyl-CoA carboxylase carboxyl transferase subunit beta [Chlamydiia bacterium]
MRLFSRSKPKIKVESTKRDGFSGWLKCTHCQEMIHANELQENLNCCPKCDYHYRLTTEERIELLADEGSFEPMWDGLKAGDPLSFVDTEAYPKRLEDAEAKSGAKEAITVGICTIDGQKTALGVFNFNFMGGSMGSVVGEKLTRLMELALEKK